MAAREGGNSYSLWLRSSHNKSVEPYNRLMHSRVHSDSGLGIGKAYNSSHESTFSPFHADLIKPLGQVMRYCHRPCFAVMSERIAETFTMPGMSALNIERFAIAQAFAIHIVEGCFCQLMQVGFR